MHPLSNKLSLSECTALKQNILPQWQTYRQWNAALCSHFFSGDYQQRPVYLDLDEHAFRKIKEQNPWIEGNGKDSLLQAVKITLHFDAYGSSPLYQHYNLTEKWQRSKYEGFPPFVGLLSLFSLVAESMAATTDYASHNFYGRLGSMLSLKEEDSFALQEDYRTYIISFWNSLNHWLQQWDGALGYPTARSLDSRKYVSIAISQSLLRDHDRLLLHRMFAEIGLTPGQRIQAPEMAALLKHWFSAGHSGSSLARLINSGADTLDRIAELSCTELELWNGHSAKHAQIGTVKYRLSVAAEIRMHPKPRLDLYLTPASANQLQDGMGYSLTSNCNESALQAFSAVQEEIHLEPINGLGFLSIEPWTEVRAGDALLSFIEMQPSVKKGPLLFRSGQPICVLSYREKEGFFREVSQAPLMERLLVLAHASVAPKVRNHLEKSSRLGFQILDSNSLEGLPSEWIAFLDVQIAKRVEEAGLDALIPVNDSTLLFSSGLRLGHETWHVSAPPEILISEPGEKELAVTINHKNPGANAKELKLGTITTGSGAFRLDALQLIDGDYEVAVALASAQSRPISICPIRLRSSANPRPWIVIAKDRLTHTISPNNAWGLISAEVERLSNEIGVFINGPIAIGASCFEVDLATYLPKSINPTKDEKLEELNRASISETLTKHTGSCVLRGYHVYSYDYVPPGSERGNLVHGACHDCQIQVWQRIGGTRQKKNRFAFCPKTHQAAKAHFKEELPTYVKSTFELGAIFDAINYWRGGSSELIAAALAAADQPPWAASEYLRELSALGHAEAEIPLHSMRATKWLLALTSIVKISGEKAVLVGWRSEELISTIAAIAKDLGGNLSVSLDQEKFPIVEIAGLDGDLLSLLCEETSTTTDIPVTFVPECCEKIAASLPHLKEVLPLLEEISIPNTEVEQFDFGSMSWVKVSKIQSAGAYRIRFHGTAYLLVTQAPNGTLNAKVGNARLVKHLAAIEAKRPLFAYSAEAEEFYVPFGCEPPGLLERALVLSSGRLPTKENGILTYTNVPSTVARAVGSRLI